MPSPVASRSPLARRIAAMIALGATVVAGLLTQTALPESAATDVAGDALYVVAIYSGLVMLFPRGRSGVVAVIAGSWSVAVELLQLTGITRAWESSFPPAALVFGSVFDARDLVIYLAAALAVYGVDRLARRQRHGHTGPESA